MSEFKFPNWDDIDEKQREIIIELLKMQGLISDETVVRGGYVTLGLGKTLCRIACKAAQAVAIEACSGDATCIAVATAVGDECHAGC